MSYDSSFEKARERARGEGVQKGLAEGSNDANA